MFFLNKCAQKIMPLTPKHGANVLSASHPGESEEVNGFSLQMGKQIHAAQGEVDVLEVFG